jgi:general secretion pathway protein D
LRIGSLRLPDGSTLADPTLDITAARIFGDFQAQLQALVVTKAARVLSRPSVLTLDNRMAYINVSERIPVAESKFAGGVSTFTQVSFREVTAGIELTVRPRVSSDGGEIGMQIAASVTAKKPGEDVIVYATDSKGEPFEVARSPTLSVREVNTFARIADNTPFIIGGLVAEDDQKMQRKVPMLGNIPVLGALFRTKHDSDGRREVIIVITPHVLPDNRSVARSLPKDADDFDSFGAELFRDAYRIRAEDVFNLSFLTGNRKLMVLQRAADLVAKDHIELAEEYPFSSFTRGRVPGERILVHRQIYEVIKRRELAETIDSSRLIFLRANEDDAGVRVGRLSSHLGRLAATDPAFQDLAAETAAAKGSAKRSPATGVVASKALALTFTKQQDNDEVKDALMEPVPEMQVLDCPDRDAWEEALWRLNQPTDAGQERFTLLLRDPGDIVRLKRAIALRHAVDLNTQTRELALRNFTVGRVLLMPAVSAEKVYLIDGDVARCFFYTEHYYRAVARELDTDTRALDEALRRPGFERYRALPEPASAKP